MIAKQEKQVHSVWLHSGRRNWTKRVWQPLEWQLRAMSNFLSTGRISDAAEQARMREMELLPRQVRYMSKSDWKSAFPFFCDVDNLERHDAYDALAYHHIYRDLWERRIPTEKPPPTTQNTFDYPEVLALMEAVIFDPTPDTVPRAEDLSWPMMPQNGGHSKQLADEDESQADTKGFHLHADSTSESPALSGGDSSNLKTGAISQEASSGAGATKQHEEITPIGRFDGRSFHYADADVDVDARIEEFFRKRRAKRQRKAGAELP